MASTMENPYDDTDNRHMAATTKSRQWIRTDQGSRTSEQVDHKLNCVKFDECATSTQQRLWEAFGETYWELNDTQQLHGPQYTKVQKLHSAWLQFTT